MGEFINKIEALGMLSTTAGGFVSVQHVLKDADDQIDALLKRNEKLEAQLAKYQAIKWVSIDKDNMEFQATITCWEKEALEKLDDTKVLQEMRQAAICK